MSKLRLVAKLRTQEWFKATVAWLDQQGIAWAVVQNNRAGHPQMTLTLPNGRSVVKTIPCTPRQNGGMERNQLAQVRRAVEALQNGEDPPAEVTSAWTPERIACLTRGVNPRTQPVGGTRGPEAR